MRLRKLEMKDAPYMLEWMHDASVVQYMDDNFLSKTIGDCERFIKEGQDGINMHRAIVDEDNVYMGTVSLKHIDTTNYCAEFAIVVRKEAMGKGYSKFGMDEIVKIGFENLKLEKIYWYVSKFNKRANCFYKKCGYKIVPDIYREIGGVQQEQIFSYYWYLIKRI